MSDAKRAGQLESQIESRAKVHTLVLRALFREAIDVEGALKLKKRHSTKASADFDILKASPP